MPVRAFDDIATVKPFDAIEPLRPQDKWDYVLDQGGSLREALPYPMRGSYDEKMSLVEGDRKGFEDKLAASLFLSNVTGATENFTFDAQKELGKYLFGRELSPSQMTQWALENEDLMDRHIWAHNKVFRAENREPPSWWEDVFENRLTAGMANVLSGLEGFLGQVEQGPQYGRWAPRLPEEESKRLIARHKAHARLYYEAAQHPDLVMQRNDAMSKLFGMIAETIPYITATSVASFATGPLGGFLVGYSVEGNSAYQEAIDAGVPEEKAPRIQAAVGIVSATIESTGALGAEKLFAAASDRIVSKGLQRGAKFGFGSITEALEEAGQELAALGGESAYQDIDWDDAVRRTLTAAGAGAAVGGTFNMGRHVVQMGLSGNVDQWRNQQRYEATRRELQQAVSAQARTYSDDVGELESLAKDLETAQQEAKQAPESPQGPRTPAEGAAAGVAETPQEGQTLAEAPAAEETPAPAGTEQPPSPLTTETLETGEAGAAQEQPWEMTREEYIDSLKREPKPNKSFTIDIGAKNVEVIQNPTSSDIRQMNREVREDFPGMPSGEAKLRFTQDANGNRYAWKAHEATHEQVEFPLGELVGEELNQNAEPTHHKRVVYEAIKEGQPVPRHVLEEYAGEPWADQALQETQDAQVTGAQAVPPSPPEGVQGQAGQEVRVRDDERTGPPAQEVGPPTAEDVAGEPPAPEDTTSARQAELNRDRKTLGLDTVNSKSRRSWAQALDRARKQDLPADALRLAGEILANPRALSDVETAGLVLRAAQIKKEHAALMNQVEGADVATTKALSARIETVESEFDALSKALYQSGTEKGRALAAQKLTINQDFSLVAVLHRAKATKGAALTAKERAKFEKLVAELAQKDAQIETLETELNRLRSEHAIKRAVSRKSGATKTRAQLTARIAELLEAGC